MPINQSLGDADQRQTDRDAAGDRSGPGVDRRPVDLGTGDAREAAKHDVVPAGRGDGAEVAVDGMDPQLVARADETGERPALVVVFLGERARAEERQTQNDQRPTKA